MPSKSIKARKDPGNAHPVSRKPNRKVRSKKQIFSAAAILKKQAKESLRKKGRAKELLSDELYLDFKNSIENSRLTLREGSLAVLQSVHHKMTENIERQVAANQDTLEVSSETFKLLGSSMTLEMVKTTLIRNNETVSEVSNLGDCIAGFKRLVERKKTEIQADRDEWKRIQEAISALGADVVGSELVHGDNTLFQTTFKRERDLIESEHARLVKEVHQDIETASKDAVLKMSSLEKELDAELRREKSKIIAALLRD